MGSILPPDVPAPFPPDYPSAEPLTRDQLMPITPNLHLDNKKHSCEPETQEFCLRHPVTVLRGLGNALKLDLGLFSTRSLVEAAPGHHVDIITQPHMSIDEINVRRVWTCPAPQSRSTIAKYANYQAATFQESVKVSDAHSNT